MDDARVAIGIEVIRQGAALGAEIRGVDFSQPVPRATADAILAALHEHKIVFFRGAHLTTEQHVAFGQMFGTLSVHPFAANRGDKPEVIVLDNHKDNPVFTTDVWHSDETFRETPPMGTILRCLKRPPLGGDTLWANMEAAFEGLSDKLQHFLSGLEAVHDFQNFRHLFDKLPLREKHAKLAQWEEQFPNPVHPVVRTHPATGRKALFVNRQFTVAIKGMHDDESRALLEFLFQQPCVPEYQFRFRWAEGDMVFWDNRPTQHYAANDYMPHRRTMERVTLVGDKPV